MAASPVDMGCGGPHPRGPSGLTMIGNGSHQCQEARQGGGSPHVTLLPACLSRQCPRFAHEETEPQSREVLIQDLRCCQQQVSLVSGPHCVSVGAAHVTLRLSHPPWGWRGSCVSWGKPRLPCRVRPPRERTPGGTHLEDTHLGAHICEQPSVAVPQAVPPTGPQPQPCGHQGLPGA